MFYKTIEALSINEKYCENYIYFKSIFSANMYTVMMGGLER